MAFTLIIDEVDYSAYMRVETLNISESNQANSASMSFTLAIQNGVIEPPLGGWEIIFSVNGVREFAGRISKVGDEATHNLLLRDYPCECVDYTADLDAEPLQITIPGQRAGDQFRALVAAVGKGFTSNHVEDGPFVAENKGDYELPSALFAKIAEAVQYQWYVDYYRDVHFFFIESYPAPVATITVDTDTTTYFDLVLEEDVSQVKNVLYLDGAKVKSGTNDSIANATGNGDIKFYPLNYQPWSIDSEDMQISVDDIPQQILLDGVDGNAGDGQGTAGQVYVCLDNWGVRFPDNFPPGDADTPANVDIDYKYANNPLIVVEDPDSIALMMEREDTLTAPSNGRHGMKFTIPELRVDTETDVYNYGTLILSRYRLPLYNAQWGSWLQGWHAGQSLVVTSTLRDFSNTIYIHSVSKSILVESATVHKLKYTVTASSSPFPG